MKQHSKRTNKNYCLVCGFEWEFCDCDQLYPEPKDPDRFLDPDDEKEIEIQIPFTDIEDVKNLLLI